VTVSQKASAARSRSVTNGVSRHAAVRSSTRMARGAIRTLALAVAGATTIVALLAIYFLGTSQEPSALPLVVRTAQFLVATLAIVVAFAALYVAVNSTRPSRALELVVLAALLDALWVILTFAVAETL
jgi:hypothetical protein